MWSVGNFFRRLEVGRPDGPFLNFRASSSGDWRLLFSPGTLRNRFRNSKVVKESVGEKIWKLADVLLIKKNISTSKGYESQLQLHKIRQTPFLTTSAYRSIFRISICELFDRGLQNWLQNRSLFVHDEPFPNFRASKSVDRRTSCFFRNVVRRISKLQIVKRLVGVYPLPQQWSTTTD